MRPWRPCSAKSHPSPPDQETQVRSGCNETAAVRAAFRPAQQNHAIFACRLRDQNWDMPDLFSTCCELWGQSHASPTHGCTADGPFAFGRSPLLSAGGRDAISPASRVVSLLPGVGLCAGSGPTTVVCRGQGAQNGRCCLAMRSRRCCRCRSTRRFSSCART